MMILQVPYVSAWVEVSPMMRCSSQHRNDQNVEVPGEKKSLLGGGFKYLLCLPLLGEMI